MNQDAELAALRRRAYGPHADIADDPAALARLTELEHRLDSREAQTAPQLAPGVATAAPGVTTAALGASTAAPAAGVAAAGELPSSRTRRPAWHTAMVAAVAAVALLTGGAAAARGGGAPEVEASGSLASTGQPATAFTFASDPSSRILLRVPVDGARGQLLDLPEPESGPDFPTDRALQWTRPLGEYYGWRLWIARDQDDNSCMLITADETFAGCVTPDEHAGGALFLSVPYPLVTAFERPASLTTEQSLGFWWVPGDTVLVLTGLTTDANRQ